MTTTNIPLFTPTTTRRGFLGASAAGALGLLAGCKASGKPPASVIQCEALPPVPVGRKFIFDRTTVPPAELMPRLVQHLEQGLAPGDHLQVLRCGGVTASLVEEVARLQLPATRLDPGQRERDRWSKSPDQIRRERHCEEEAMKALNLSARLNEVVADTDAALQARSPVFEAIAAAASGWQGLSLELWSDGLEHLGAGRSFYGPGQTLRLPEPGAWALMMAGIAAIGFLRSRQRSA